MTKTRMFHTILFLAIALLLAGSASAINLGGDSGTLSWNVDSANDGLKLSIGGPDGFNWEREYDAGEAPTFSIFDKNGMTLADGQYTWSLVVYPSLDDTTRKAMLAAREAGDQTALGQLQKSLGQTEFSGTFRIEDGSAMRPTAMVEGGLQKDQVINDDLIVSFSACIGNDCVNGESFGFDTLRLKENNLRIHFDDTSSSASFPTNNWRIIANDSSNGGASYLAFEDSDAGTQPFRVDAGAGSNALRIKSGGNVGMGNNNPVVELHVTDGDSPTLRLEQNGSSGFTAQTYDVAANEANFFIRDVTNGSKLFFRAKPGAPENSIFVAADGDIGLGTASPDAGLHVIGDTMLLSTTDTGAGSAEGLEIANDGATAQRIMLRLDNNGAPQSEFENTAVGVTWRFGQNDNGDFVINDTADLATAEMRITVDGNVFVNGGQVHPDYVFAPDYDLMPLSEVEAFVKQNRHLPNVQSATDRDQAGGVNITALPLQLLEKVEELTLHTIDQEKKIESLSQRNAELAAKVEALLENAGQ